jgi:hypothetical protein
MTFVQIGFRQPELLLDDEHEEARSSLPAERCPFAHAMRCRRSNLKPVADEGGRR